MSATRQWKGVAAAWTRIWGLGAVVFVGLAAPVGALELTPCEAEALQGAQCGTLTVFEDRDAGSGRTLDLNVVVLPSLEEPARPDPLFFLTGGPGQGATTLAQPMLQLGDDLRRNRDVVLVDQRGTGRSNPLQCPLPEDLSQVFGTVLRPATLAACREELESRADLSLYTTAIAMDDLDEVRSRLGYDKINLWGLSYGTRAGMTYLRRHPEHARTAVLEGLARTGSRSPLYYARHAQRAADLLFSECEADPACSEAFPNARHEMRVLLDRLRGGPVDVTVEAQGGEKVEAQYSLGDFGYTVRGMLYGNAQAMRLPAMLHRAAAENDFSGFAQRFYQRSAGLSQFVADGMYLSVFCAEDVPHFDDAEALAETEGTFLGRHLIDDYREACAEWPRADIPEGYLEPVRSDVPVLIVSGDRDPVTPPSAAEVAEKHFTATRHIVVQRTGHGVVLGTPCLFAAVREFLDSGSVEGLDVSCLDDLPEPTFVLDLDADNG